MTGDRIYCFGGYCTGDNYKMKTPIDLFILNPHTYRWKEVPKPRTDSAEAEDWPYQRYGHTVSARSGMCRMQKVRGYKVVPRGQDSCKIGTQKSSLP